MSTAPPESTPAWWIHYLNVALSTAAFVGVAVHPGWHPPAVLVLVVGPLALVLAVGSGMVFAVLHHKAGQADLAAAGDYLRSSRPQLAAAARDVAPLVDHYHPAPGAPPTVLAAVAPDPGPAEVSPPPIPSPTVGVY
jgi:hypothetical protein